MDRLVNHETNIWACIYRLVDTHGPLTKEVVE